MRIPENATIRVEKLTHYLLVHRLEDDKSKFLARAGFQLDNFRELEQAIRKLAAERPASQDGANDFGTFYRQDGNLAGPTGAVLSVTLIWLQWHDDETFHFVTLKPRKA
jgi:hypothetical protein